MHAAKLFSVSTYNSHGVTRTLASLLLLTLATLASIGFLSYKSLSLNSIKNISINSNFIGTQQNIQILNKILSPSNKLPQKLSPDDPESQLLKKKRKYYGGGDIDEKHLGGFLLNDSKSYERELWEYVIPRFNINSVIDIGCGTGVSTVFFASKIPKYISWNNVLCVEGSYDAINKSHVKNITVQHDYSLGPYWPDRVFDMAWSIEFLEHVNETFMDNYMATFKKAKLLLVTASRLGGWSHLNVHHPDYWIDKFESYGFIYDSKLTKICRRLAYLFPTIQGHYWYHGLKDGRFGNNTKRFPYFHYNGLAFHNFYFYNNLTLENINKFKRVTLFDKMLLQYATKT